MTSIHTLDRPAPHRDAGAGRRRRPRPGGRLAAADRPSRRPTRRRPTETHRGIGGGRARRPRHQRRRRRRHRRRHARAPRRRRLLPGDGRRHHPAVRGERLRGADHRRQHRPGRRRRPSCATWPARTSTSSPSAPASCPTRCRRSPRSSPTSSGTATAVPGSPTRPGSPRRATTRRRSATPPATPPGCCCRTPTRHRRRSSAAATSTSRREAFLAFEAGLQAVDDSFTATYIPTGDFNDVAGATEAYNQAVADGVGAVYPFLGGSQEAIVGLANEDGIITMSAGTVRRVRARGARLPDRRACSTPAIYVTESIDVDHRRRAVTRAKRSSSWSASSSRSGPSSATPRRSRRRRCKPSATRSPPASSTSCSARSRARPTEEEHPSPRVER